MKYLLFLFVLISCCSCGKTRKDSRMVIKSRKYDNRMVYYQTRGDSISKNSYALWTCDGKVMLEVHHNLFDLQYFESHGKVDSTIVDDVKPFNEGKYFVPTFSEQMSEMKECLRVASKDYNLCELDHFVCFLSSFDSIAVAVTSGLMSDIRNNGVDFSTIDRELSKTCLKDSLNSVLKNFKLRVDTIMSQEHILFVHMDELFQNSSSISDSSSPLVVDTELYISLKHKK